MFLEVVNVQRAWTLTQIANYKPYVTIIASDRQISLIIFVAVRSARRLLDVS